MQHFNYSKERHQRQTQWEREREREKEHTDDTYWKGVYWTLNRQATTIATATATATTKYMAKLYFCHHIIFLYFFNEYT